MKGLFCRVSLIISVFISRIINILRFKKPKRWRTVAAAVLSLTMIAACAADPSKTEAAPDIADLYGSYEFDNTVYMWLASSFAAVKGNMPTYIIGEEGLTIRALDGTQTHISGFYSRLDFNAAEFIEGFDLNIGIPDVSTYKTCSIITIDGNPTYRIYVMDDEIWFASLHNDFNSAAIKFNSIYKLKKVSGFGEIQATGEDHDITVPPPEDYSGNVELTPQGQLAPDAAYIPTTDIENQLFTLYDGSDSLITQMTSDGRSYPEYAITDSWRVEQFTGIFSWFDWEIDILPGSVTTESMLTISSADKSGSFTFFEGSGHVLYTSGGTDVWYKTTANNDQDHYGDIYESILLQYYYNEGSYWNTPAFASGGDFEETAYQFMDVFTDYLKNMSPGNKNRVIDLDVLKLEVFLTEKGNDDKFGFWCDFVMLPEQYDKTDWWAGNSTAGTGEYKDWLTMYREIRLERGSDGLWRCTGMGTGGMTLN